MTNINSYSEAAKTLKNRSSRKVGGNLLLAENAGNIELQFYGQTIFQWQKNGSHSIVKPQHMPGGQLTVTTKRHLNNFMPNNMRVFTQKRIDMVTLDGAADSLTIQLFR